jgi:transposase
MIYVGIDAASMKHDFAIMNENGDIIVQPTTIGNDKIGFEKLYTEILSHTELTHEVCIGIEETGIYAKNLSSFLYASGFNVFNLNPLLTSFSQKSTSLRKTKTDPIDAKAICRYIRLNHSILNSYTPTLYTFEELRSLSRIRFEKQLTLSQAKMEFTRLLMIIFPEFLKHYDQHSKWAKALFAKYPTPKQIARMHIDTLVSILGIQGDRLEAANHIKTLAKDSVGQVSTTQHILITSALDDIFHYEAQMRNIDKAIDELMSEFDFFKSIPGIGNITGAMILGEIGNIERFKSASSLLAFAGLDPSVFQSGEFESKNSHISKRGSKYLRSALFTATRVACIGKGKNNKFREKYVKKRSQNKHHYSAICAACKNMVNTIFKMLHTGENFSYNY